VQDAAIDLVLNIFAPRNFAETARVLRPGGWLALVYPEANHLIGVCLRQQRAVSLLVPRPTHDPSAPVKTIGFPVRLFRTFAEIRTVDLDFAS
jgi:hypothetical protein